MPWVMRVRGYSYGGEEGPGEHVHGCYVTRDGQASTLRAQARVYTAEAEAWEHAVACGLIDEGAEDESGPICWAEEV